MIVAASLSCWTACSNEDDDPVDEPEDPEEFIEETEPLTRQDSLDIAFMNVVSTLCQTDSTLYEQGGSSGNFSPDYGTVLYTVTPTVRYNVAESTEDAKGKFSLAFATAIDFAGAQDDGNTIRIDLGSKGTIEFEPAQEDGKVGVLIVNVPQIPDLTQIVWLQNEAWPLNEDNGGASIGKTFKSPDGKRWVCIQTPESAPNGILVTFDNTSWLPAQWDPSCSGAIDNDPGWHYTHYYLDERDWKSWLHGYASSEDLKVLNIFMYNNHGASHDPKADDVFNNPKFMSADMYNAIYGQDRYYCCGDMTWAYRTEAKHKYEYYYYSEHWLHKGWRNDSKKNPYTFMGNRWYIMRHNWEESYLKDDRWNSYDCRDVSIHELHLDGKSKRRGDYDEKTYRNYDKVKDHKTYIKVEAYHFGGDFFNEKTMTYKDGFVYFDLTSRR